MRTFLSQLVLLLGVMERRETPRIAAVLATFMSAAVLAQPVPDDSTPPPVGAVPGDDDPRLESPLEARAELQRDVLKYQQLIEQLEVTQGPFASGLPEQLLGMGLALQRNGNHEQAVEAFKRGVHLSRISEGLYNSRQMALLRGEIESLVALGALETADERQRYLYRVQVRTLSDRPRGEALMQHALWQRQAYEAGLGEMPEQRLLRMWSLHRLALTEIAEAEGETSPALLPPLYGMLRAQYLISGFVGETTSGRYRSRYGLADQESQQVAYRGQSFKQGAAVIRAIFDVQRAQPGVSTRDSMEPMLLLGDWQLWHGKRDDAFGTYAELEGELAELDDAQALRMEFFDRPAPLPTLDGVRAFPEPIEQQDGVLLLEFGVSARGKVVDLNRLDEYAAFDDKADDIMRRLRQTPFRPRISDGMPVETTGLVVAYDINDW